LASLGSCVGVYTVKYLQARDLDIGELSIDTSDQKTTDNPIRMDNIEIRLSLPIALSDHRQQGLQKAMDDRIIHNTFIQSPNITTQIVHTAQKG
jgi:uncharacterized OsmC-like protein